MKPYVDKGVPYYIHNHYGEGRHARLVSIQATDLLNDGNDYREEPPLTGDESRIAEVSELKWPELLEPIDDLPPATIITRLQHTGGQILAHGVTHDNSDIAEVTVNGQRATIVRAEAGVVDWVAAIQLIPGTGVLAQARDSAGNLEQTPHQRQ